MPHNEEVEKANSTEQEVTNQQEQPVAEPEVIAATGEQPAEEPAYTPNYKFKVLDQEKEFDDWIRQAVNKDNEAKIRELYEKAHGLDHVKSQREQERQTREKTEKEFNEFYSGVQEIVGLKEKDLTRFFKEVNLPRHKVAQWLLEQAKLEELPEETKRVYSEREALRLREENLQRELEIAQAESVSQAVQARQRELQGVMASDEVKGIAEAFDKRVGKANAFMDAVIRHGKAEWEASGGKRDLTPAEAVKEVLSFYGLSAQAASPAATPNEPATKKVVTAAKPTVLPNVGTGSSSPTGAKRPKSTDDLRALYKELAKSAG